MSKFAFTDATNAFGDVDIVRRRRIGWYLIAFGNSILVLNGELYFTQWIVINQNLSDVWFNLALVVVSVVLIVAAPFFGAISDQSNNMALPLRWTSLGMFLGAGGIYALTKIPLSNLGKGIIGLTLLSITLFFYQLGMVFVNALLGELVAPDQYLSTSGRGLAADWIGGVFGVLATYPFVAGEIFGLGVGGRTAAFLPSVVLFTLFCGSGLLLLGGGDSRSRQRSLSPRAASAYRDTLRTWRSLFSEPTLGLFLAGFFLFGDAILTVQNNAAIYLNQVMGFGDTAKSILFLLLLFMAAIGGISSGRLVELPNAARVLVLVLFGWVLVLGSVAFVQSQWLFVILFAVIGLLFGMTWTLSRGLFIAMIPAERRGQYFGLYTTFERVSTVVGPLFWSLPFLFSFHNDTERYRIAMLTMALLVAASIPFIWRNSISAAITN